MLRAIVAAVVSSMLLICLPAHAAESAPVPRVLELDEALAELDAQSFTLAQARSRIDEARAVVRQATAPLLPALVATGSYVRNSDDARVSLGGILAGLSASIGAPPGSVSMAGAPDLVIQPLESFTAGASLRVPLFAGHAWWDRAAAVHGVEAATASAESARRQLRTGLVQAAWFASAAEQVTEAAEQALRTGREHAANAERSLRAGLASPLGKLQADTEVVQRESELARAVAERDRAWLALGALLGKPERVRIELPEIAPVPELEAAALVGEALAVRPELDAGRAAVGAAESQLDAARWRHAPQLSAAFSGFASTEPYPTGDTSGWRASLDLSWTLYDGGFRYGRADQARAALTSARAGLESSRVEIARQVEDAVRDVAVARERLRLAEQQKALAQEAAAQARASFEAGVASSLDALDANDRAWRAEVGLAEARARVGASEAALAQAIGRGP